MFNCYSIIVFLSSLYACVIFSFFLDCAKWRLKPGDVLIIKILNDDTRFIINRHGFSSDWGGRVGISTSPVLSIWSLCNYRFSFFLSSQALNTEAPKKGFFHFSTPFPEALFFVLSSFHLHREKKYILHLFFIFENTGVKRIRTSTTVVFKNTENIRFIFGPNHKNKAQISIFLWIIYSLIWAKNTWHHMWNKWFWNTSVCVPCKFPRKNTRDLVGNPHATCRYVINVFTCHVIQFTCDSHESVPKPLVSDDVSYYINYRKW